MEYIAYAYSDCGFTVVLEAENEADLRRSFGEKSTYTPLGGGVFEIRHPFNPNRPMLAVPRAR
jgi:hypothetical protein